MWNYPVHLGLSIVMSCWTMTIGLYNHYKRVMKKCIRRFSGYGPINLLKTQVVSYNLILNSDYNIKHYFVSFFSIFLWLKLNFLPRKNYQQTILANGMGQNISHAPHV